MPDLNEVLAGCAYTTWRDKRAFCRLEGRSYALAGEPASSNPYVAGTWPWYWFNEAYLEQVDCVVA